MGACIFTALYRSQLCLLSRPRSLYTALGLVNRQSIATLTHYINSVRGKNFMRLEEKLCMMAFTEKVVWVSRWSKLITLVVIFECVLLIHHYEMCIYLRRLFS